MIQAVGILAAYVGAMWWLMDRGRTPVLATVCVSLATLCGNLAVTLGALAFDLDRRAYALIRRRSLA